MWLGPGLGSVAKKTYDKMIKWEYVDLAELRQRNPGERLPGDQDTQKLVVLPGFELAQAKQKPVNNIFTWANCYARYVGAMAKEHPGSIPGFMAHLVTVLKTYVEVEDPAWRQYDEAYREKMAATGCKLWEGMDVQLHQEICAARQRKLTPASAQGQQAGGEVRPGAKRLQRAGERTGVCWQFNAGRGCTFGWGCKFRHECQECGGDHPKTKCDSERRKRRK